jgi:60 kDa SS-A/Ro ribonucleoprotein
MKNYIKYLNPPQSQPIPGENMVKNNAGGYVYAISDQEALERFLLLGSEGGTYYVSEEKLTHDNATRTIENIKKDGRRVLNTILSFCSGHRAPKHNAILFTYALLLTFADIDARKLAYSYISEICYTPTHLFQLLTFLKPLRGWSRGLRKAVANWYLCKSDDKLAYQVVKYRSRSGYTHRDVLRLCHPKTSDERTNQLYRYMVGKECIPDLLPEIIKGYEYLRTVAAIKDIPEVIEKYGLTWEMIPNEMLNVQSVLKSLLLNMPLNALMRNLNRYAYIGLTEGRSHETQVICEKLCSPMLVLREKIHPISVMQTICTYRQGHGDKGNKSWQPNQHILDALHEMYSLAMQTIAPTNKRILIGVDVSGSMSGTDVANMSMTCSQISLILAHTMLKTEPNVEMIGFTTQVMLLPFGKRNSIDDLLQARFPSGGTDCSIPIAHALITGKEYDAIIILTDSETWAGNVHAKVALDQYRKRIGVQTKVIEIALAANPYTNFPPDPNILRIVGFDASVITVLQEFLGRS